MPAAGRGHVAVVRRLCALGADTSLRTSHNASVLHIAVAGKGCPETIQVLVEYGAEVDARSSEGWTAAHCAVLLRRVRALARLYQLGADLSLRTNNGANASDLAAALNLSHTLRAIAHFPEHLPRLPRPSRSAPSPPAFPRPVASVRGRCR